MMVATSPYLGLFSGKSVQQYQLIAPSASLMKPSNDADIAKTTFRILNSIFNFKIGAEGRI